MCHSSSPVKRTKPVVRVLDEPEELLGFHLLDPEVPSYRQVHQGRRDVPGVGTVVHQRPDFGRGHSVGGLVLGIDASAGRVLPPPLPDQEHAEEAEKGRKRSQFDRRKSPIFLDSPGAVTTPGSQPTTTVSPSRKLRPPLVSK